MNWSATERDILATQASADSQARRLTSLARLSALAAWLQTKTYKNLLREAVMS
jgi:hypothetical protein